MLTLLLMLLMLMLSMLMLSSIGFLQCMCPHGFTSTTDSAASPWAHDVVFYFCVPYDMFQYTPVIEEMGQWIGTIFHHEAHASMGTLLKWLFMVVNRIIHQFCPHSFEFQSMQRFCKYIRPCLICGTIG